MCGVLVYLLWILPYVMGFLTMSQLKFSLFWYLLYQPRKDFTQNVRCMVIIGIIKTYSQAHLSPMINLLRLFCIQRHIINFSFMQNKTAFSEPLMLWQESSSHLAGQQAYISEVLFLYKRKITWGWDHRCYNAQWERTVGLSSLSFSGSVFFSQPVLCKRK